MRNIFFAVAVILVGTFANSNAKSSTLSEISVFNEIELKLDLGDLTDKSETEINEEIGNFIKNNLYAVDDGLQCKVTVTGSINVGVGSVEISVEVSGPCSEIKEKGTEIANMILEAVKKAMQ